MLTTLYQPVASDLYACYACQLKVDIGYRLNYDQCQRKKGLAVSHSRPEYSGNLV